MVTIAPPVGIATLVVVASDVDAAAARIPQPVATIFGEMVTDPGRELDNVAEDATMLPLDEEAVKTPGIGAWALSCTACMCLFKTDLWVQE